MITEDRLQQQIFTYHWNKYPEERGLLFMVHNNPRNKIEGAQLKARGMISGVSDMIYLRPKSKPLFLELKLPKGRQSKSQEEWEQKIIKAGYDYKIARSLTNVKEICKWER